MGWCVSMAWRYNSAALIAAQSKIRELRARTDLLEHERPTKANAQIAARVRQLLDEAEAAATASGKQISWWNRRWHVSNVQAAFQAYHAARAVAVGLYAERDVDIELPGALARAKERLGPDDKRVSTVEKLMADSAPLDDRRAWLQQLVLENYHASDDAHRRLLQLRNVLWIGVVGVFVLMILTSLALAKEPTWAPLCFEGSQALPEGTQVDVEVVESADDDAVDPSSVEAVEKTTVCPTDEGVDVEGTRGDVLAVVLMGFIGGSFAAVIAVRGLGGTRSPFSVAVPLAILKSPTGALTALAGLIAIRGNFVPGLSDLDSPEQILAYALVLGYAQQLATGFLDRRAKEIAEKT